MGKLRTKQLQVLEIALVIALTIFVAFTGYRDLMGHYTKVMQKQQEEAHRTAQEINDILKSSKDHLNLISDLIEKASAPEGNINEVPANLPRYLSAKDKFHLTIPLKKSAGALSGLGNPSDFTKVKQSQLDAVAALSSSFEVAYGQIPGVQWLYFVSSDQWILLYPFTTPEAYLFSRETMDKDFYTLALPSKNPERSVKSTRVYEDEAGAGLMVTLTKPVYRKDSFVGALAIDFTLTKIEEILQSHPLEHTAYQLINEYGEALSTAAVTDRVSEKLYAAFFQDTLLTVAIPLDEMPWQLKSYRKASAVYGDILLAFTPFLLLLVVLLAFLVLLMRKIRLNAQHYDSQLKFEQVVNQAVQMMAILDKQGYVIYVNQMAMDLFGTATGDLIGTPFYESPWWQWSDALGDFMKEAIEKCRSGESVHRDLVHRNQLGEARHVAFSLHPIFDARGNIQYLMANGIDITDRVKLKDSMERLSKIDMLTNIFNRRGAAEALEHEVSRAIRQGTDLSILIGDIDFFKRINDTFGHQVGDQVLIQVSTLMQEALREYDIVGRWGGEEFIIILPGTGLEAAEETAQRLCRGIRERNFFDSLNLAAVTFQVTITLGVATYDIGMDINDLIKGADDALYLGKNSGRNQVICHPQQA